MPKSAMPSSNLRSTFVIVTDHKALPTPRLLAAHRRKTERDFELPYATSKKHLEPANEKYVQTAQRRCHAIRLQGFEIRLCGGDTIDCPRNLVEEGPSPDTVKDWRSPNKTRQ
ncbi:hypothetical protein JTE90_005946 [Oedothorax gibbosus]|uniref:Uncharacterized protein n=1 Tax=Oedothorax gibbosus TaxID=931172 RepID=A0AAV6UW96_9ARAC|nr:hypothetical protein JTE90_005946 [Oedothorax gibbosus]